MNRDALRVTLRQRRRAIGPIERDAATRAVARAASRLLRTLPAGARVGAYLALPDEIDARSLIARLERRGCAVFLPRITNYRLHTMVFAAARPPYRRNRYGIDEPPASAPTCRASQLDLVLVPLVGFDARGTRLGMGGGFYDRAFAFRHRRRSLRRPLLVGLAFECQRVERLPAGTHDVRLDAVITERGITRFNREHT
jgi:5-formyltetrahydrofolate cyclo-ligase